MNLWAREEIKVEIVVTANAPSDNRAAEYLSSVNVDEKRVKNVISLTTRIDRNQFGNNGWNKSKGDKNFIQIDYTIYMPKENSLTVRNKFGNTDIPSFYAPLTVDSKHGNFMAMLLENPGQCDRYSVWKCQNRQNGRRQAGLPVFNVKVDQAKKVWLSNKFGELTIGDVVNLDALIDYSGAKIGTIRGTGKSSSTIRVISKLRS